MNDNIVVPATGQSSPVLLNSPNADQTNSLRSTRSLADLLAACVEDPTVTASLFDLTSWLSYAKIRSHDFGQNLKGFVA
jgi:hypothetical protein